MKSAPANLFPIFSFSYVRDGQTVHAWGTGDVLAKLCARGAQTVQVHSAACSEDDYRRAVDNQPTPTDTSWY